MRIGVPCAGLSPRSSGVGGCEVISGAPSLRLPTPPEPPHAESELAASTAAALLVAIRLRGIDVAIAELHGVLDGGLGVAVVDEPGPQAELRNLEAIRQRVGLFKN